MDSVKVIARVLLDTGPLVAVLARDDPWHEQCTDQLHSIKPPLVTCWPVLVEADWLLRNHPSLGAARYRAGAPLAVQQMLHWVNTGVIRVVPVGEEATVWIMHFLRKYQKLRPQLADACLVYVAEQEDIEHVFTLDRHDFSTYRFGRNRSFNLIPG